MNNNFFQVYRICMRMQKKEFCIDDYLYFVTKLIYCNVELERIW